MKRALLHGTIIALHPNPNKKTLEHFMHQDLIKIAWDFIVKLAISGKIYMNGLQDTLMNEGQDTVEEEESHSKEKEDRLD